MFSGKSNVADFGLGVGALHAETDETGAGLGVSLGEGAGVEFGEEETSVYCWAGCPQDYDDATLDEMLREAEALTDCGGATGCDTGPPDPQPGSGSFGPHPGAGSAGSYGDPHLVTVDGLRYDMHGVGEYVALAADTGDMEIQIRQQPVPGSRTLSINTGVAVRAGGDRVAVTPAGTSGIEVRVAGGPPVAPGTTTLPGGATLRVAERQAALWWPDGSAVGVSRNPLALDLGVDLADARQGHVRGLLGPFGPRDGRVEARDGTPVAFADLADRDGLYRRFADTWRITQEESLFDYAPGQSTATITDPTYPDPAPPLPEPARAAAEELCRHLGVAEEMRPACIVDVAATGDAGFADAAVAGSRTSPGTPPPVGGGTRLTDGRTVTGHVDPGAPPSATTSTSAAPTRWSSPTGRARPAAATRRSASTSWTSPAATSPATAAP
ncbi:hypothetical protein BJF78_08085 [Pseudonocardia sp. CNS-139]|nr:hypothetical protein BJF78_08085 [Pseudonocardia sp. CNS-139]